MAKRSGSIGVTEFKAHCLELLDRLHDRGGEIVLTRRGEPIARVLPIRKSTAPLRGLFRGKIHERGDIVHVDWSEDWEAAAD